MDTVCKNNNQCLTRLKGHWAASIPGGDVQVFPCKLYLKRDVLKENWSGNDVFVDVSAC